MKNVFFLLTIFCLCSCSKPVLEKKYNSVAYAKDVVELNKKLDERTFSNLTIYIDDFKNTSIHNFTYKQLIRLADDYGQERSIKEIETKIAIKKKMICSKKWYIKSIKTSASGEFEPDIDIEIPEDNLIFEKGYKCLKFKKDNTFEQIRKGDPEVEKGKWHITLTEFVFDGENYKIDLINDEKIIMTSIENKSYGDFSTNIKQRLEMLAFKDDSFFK